MSESRTAIRLLILTAAVVGGFALWHALPAIQAHLAGGEPRAVAARGALAPAEESRIALFEQARDSVVSISTSDRRINPFTRRVTERRRGQGSGFVWDAAGHIVTNDHVIAGVSRARVGLADGRTIEARLIGRDPSNDLAVLRIETGEIRPPPIPIGTSDDLAVGQSVLAIGNPFGLDWTLTSGIVSALERDLPIDGGRVIRDVIQTDAAINPGNSGGPLLDSAGRLIGVNTAIYSPSGSNAGIGFAVPVDTVNRIVPRLIAEGRYAPPSIGIGVDRRAQRLARLMRIDGVMVMSVEPGSPAEAAGVRAAEIARDGRVRAGDTLVEIDGRRVRTAQEVVSLLSGRRPGEEVEIVLFRDGETRRLVLPVVEAS
ncbi:MAG: trypsin-like peptidase domain-containing protein [Pseudomonadota bacterium]